MIVLRKEATKRNIADIIKFLGEYELGAHPVEGATGISTLQIIGDEPPELKDILPGLEGVYEYMPVNAPFKIVSREHHPEFSQNGDTRIVRVGKVKFGGKTAVVGAGPCAVYTKDQMLETAKVAQEGGAKILRGGAYKPRTSPHSFSGIGEPGLEMLAEAGVKTGMPVVTEVTDPRDVKIVAKYADMLQIGARNMQTYALLVEAGESGKPILLKRHFGATVSELLQSAEWIASTGNLDIILCERGIRTFSNPEAGRFTLDEQAIEVARDLSYLPIIADPSPAAGRSKAVPRVARAALEAGAHGLLIEIMRQDEQPRISYELNGRTLTAGFCDYAQALREDTFLGLMKEIRGKRLGRVKPLH